MTPEPPAVLTLPSTPEVDRPVTPVASPVVEVPMPVAVERPPDLCPYKALCAKFIASLNLAGENKLRLLPVHGIHVY